MNKNLKRVAGLLRSLSPVEFNYTAYWDKRYATGGDSGLGSQGMLAEFKTEIINSCIETWAVESIVDFGCGDGEQLRGLSPVPYLGLDVARSSLDLCRQKFQDDPLKSFMLYAPRQFTNKGFIQADLVLCLDVLYHITNEEDYYKTLADVFATARRYVILYTTTQLVPTRKNSHIYCRDTLRDLSAFPEFTVEAIVPQKYPEHSTAEFILLSKKN